MRLVVVFVFFIFGILQTVIAQPPCSTIPGMTPQTAIAVCGTTVFNQNSVASCQGPAISGTGACGGTNASDNAFWYKFHCYQSGTLGFLITPQDLNDDYDWELFDVTGIANLNQVYTDERLMVSLNLCGSPNGITGCAPSGIDSINCGGNTNLINRLATITAGKDYLLMVNNWSNSGFGYSLKFEAGTAVITDNTLPLISSAAPVDCRRSSIKVVFSKDIKCSSVTASGSEFSFSPPGPVITGIVSNCSSAANTITELTIQLQTPMPTGNYALIVNPGSDLNTFTDVCDNDMSSGFSIPFSIGEPPPPIIQSFGYNECHRDRLIVNFDKPVDCASLTANGSEFRFVPAGPVITSISSNCGTGNYTNSVTIFLQGQVPTQIFNLIVFNGTDGNTLSDTCLSFMPQGSSKSFTGTLPPPLVLDSLQYDKCEPAFVKLFYNHPIFCNKISQDGSQFRFVFPSGGPLNVVSASADPAACTLGYTNSILVQFSAPINASGTYIMGHALGSNGQYITDTCNSFFPNPFFSLNVIKPSAAFNSQVKWGCGMDTIVLSHPGGNNASSWLWSFGDGSTASGQSVTYIAPVTTPFIDVQLIVSNGICSDTASQSIALGNYFKAGFINNNPPDTFCINAPVSFADTSQGSFIAGYLWDFGDMTQYNGQVPPPHAYAAGGNYLVKLIVTDIFGCKDTAIKNIYIVPTPAIDFTGLRSQYCTGNILRLTRKISRYIISYVWDNGDGQTFTNEVDVDFSYANEGNYTITLSGIDRYCGTATVSKTVPVYKVPVVELPADTILCQNEQMLIGVQPVANYSYLWSTGETSPQIFTSIFSRNYRLTVYNMGCSGYDVMAVKVLPVCLIKVPNAFTPNRDGLNEELKALNADMAKSFSFKIFNRVGQLVFATNDPLTGWDGRFKGQPAQAGTYVWMLSYIDPWNGKAVKEKGSSILLR